MALFAQWQHEKFFRIFQEKRAQEVRPLERIGDSFRKIIVVHDNISARRDESGITTIGIRKFLLDENSLEL